MTLWKSVEDIDFYRSLGRTTAEIVGFVVPQIIQSLSNYKRVPDVNNKVFSIKMISEDIIRSQKIPQEYGLILRECVASAIKEYEKLNRPGRP